MELINYVLHFERYIPIVISHFGNGIYALLFFIVFAETGFVITPFLPGDSLLFVVGTVAGGGYARSRNSRKYAELLSGNKNRSQSFCK